MRTRALVSALVTTAALAAGCGTTTPAAPATPAPSAAAAPHAGRHGQGIRGTVTAEDGSTWTVTTDARGPFTVTVTPQTAFGTRKAPATAQAFPVGTHVRVAGTVDGSTVTAARIVAAAGRPDAGTSAAPTASTAPAADVLPAPVA